MKISICVYSLFLLLCFAAIAVPGQNLRADYQFQGNLNSTGPTAPPLLNVGLNSFVTDTVDGYTRQTLRFPFDGGVLLSPSTSVIPNGGSYTIVILFRFDQISGFRRVVDFANRTTDDGAYIQDGRLEFENTANAPFLASTYIQIVICRDAAGTVRGYRDGGFRVNQPDGGTFQITGANALRFFQDDLVVPNEMSAGNVARIRLYDAPMTTTQVRALDRLPNVGGGAQPILFSSGRDGFLELYSMNADGSNQRRLTNTELPVEAGAKWSPNGQRVVYVRREISTSNVQIWIMNADGSGQTRLTNNAGNDQNPSWRPDGTKIVFSRCDASNVCDLFTMNPDGTSQTELPLVNTANDEDVASYSPDGSKIIFVCSTSGATFANQNICTANADGSNRQQITSTLSPIANSDPVFSPDGTRIAFSRQADQANFATRDIFTMNADGSGQTNRTNNAVADFLPIWSADGSKIAFTTARDTINEIYVMNSDGSLPNRLTFNSVVDTVTDWYRPVGAPTLGNYPATSVSLSANATITPDAAPTGATSITVSTATSFNGRFVANLTTGVIRLTNAQPAHVPPGPYLVTVRAFGPGGSTPKTFNLTVTPPTACPAITFGAPANFPAGVIPRSVAVGDFNGDGNQDIATANDTSNNVSILTGNGTGSFSAAVNFGVGTGPFSVAVGDFNGDGNQDIATANSLSNNVSILTGNGTGSFSVAVNFGVGTSPFSVAVGDFNGDGNQDIAASNATSNSVSILTGNGAGSFTAAVNFGVGSNPLSVAVGDFNGDGNQDIAVANAISNNVSILTGNGEGAFAAAVNIVVGTLPVSVAVGDFNGDGNQDIAVANQSSGDVSILTGNGAGSFAAAVSFGVGTQPRSVAVGDFNGDGNQDIAVANSGSNTVSILTGNGAGSFAAAVDFSAGSSPFSVSVGDFNGDGVQDFATANSSSNNVSIRLGTCSGPTCAPTAISYGQSFNSILTGNSCLLGGNRTDLYTFAGTANQQIAIAMETSQFFSKIELLNPAGAIIQTAGGDDSLNNSRLPATGYFTLPVSGTYTIRAIAAFGGSGAYNISLFEVPVQTCTYSLSPTVTSVASAGGTFFFDVLTQPGCPPAAAPAASGTIYDNLTYNGGRVTFRVAVNTGAACSDTITVAGQTHAINQFGAAPPVNDLFASAEVIVGVNSPPGSPTRGSNANASAQNGEQAHAGNPAIRSVWYAWTTPALSSGLYSFSTSGSSFDTVMAIYACPGSFERMHFCQYDAGWVE